MHGPDNEWKKLYHDNAQGMLLGFEYMMEHFDIQPSFIAEAIEQLTMRPRQYDPSFHPSLAGDGQ